MLALGWTLFAALYFIGMAHGIASDMVQMRVAPYQKWTWRWGYLAWPVSDCSFVLENWRTCVSALFGAKV